MKFQAKKVLKVVGASLVMGAVTAGNAMAELPASVAADVAAAKVDIVSGGALVIGVAVAIAAVRWVKRLF